MSEQNTRKYTLSAFFSSYFGNFGKLLITNLMFCVPLGIFITILTVLTVTMGQINWFIALLLIPFMSPFFAGLTNVCRKLAANRSFSPVKDFFGGIKSNWLFFLINSMLLYALSSGMMIMLVLNRETGGSGPIFAYLIIISLTSLLFILMELSAIVMAVSVEIGFADIIKNSLLLVVKGFAGHLKTLFALLFVSFLLYSVAALINQLIPILIVLGVLTLLTLPALLMYIIVFNSYQTVEKHIISPYAKDREKYERLKEEKEKEEKITPEELESLAKGDPEEYVFLNGKTVKRKTIIKMLEVRRNGNTSEE